MKTHTNNSSLPSTFHRLRVSRGISLPGLTEISGIGRNALSGLEDGSHTATIDTVWQLAKALGLTFGDLVEHATAVTDARQEDGLNVCLVDKQSGPSIIESYLMELPAGAARKAEAHAVGAMEHLVMLKGAMLTGPENQPALISAGQHYSFTADVPHIYRCLDRPAVAMVTVVYPEVAVTAGNFDMRNSWPRHDDEWQAIRMQVARCQLEVAQGISAFRIRFDDCGLAPKQALAELFHRLNESRFTSPICSFMLFDELPSIVGFQRPHGHAPLTETPACCSVLKQAVSLVNRNVAPAGTLTDVEAGALLRQAEGPVLVLAALAAETLTRHGIPCAPAFVAPKIHVPKPAIFLPSHATFEDRIDVNAYAAYELLHPAYAKQSVAIAQVVNNLERADKLRLLEIGTGPGTSLQLLLEMVPALEVVAVEPSEIAFAHLSDLFKDDERVLAEAASITDFGGKHGVFDIAVSVGASHHLNTSNFLQSARENLKPRALFIVSDEMIAPFNNPAQRQRNLITHHLQYVADTLVRIDTETISTAERRLVEGVQQEVPLALYEAHADLTEAAANRCRRLLGNLKALVFPEPVSHPLLAFYRFHYLELEALVAGLDYEVEQKTYPARFRDLALHAGFEIVKHSRLYATQGDDDWDAGTHFFVLKAMP
ncbi:methyltransferase domain-containing protein [Oxalobacteraceae bacterium CAVE-383]|nr:methyltransferase domain-containing protein [Oxalobacteraceae bacterium CAVE-383]